MEYRAVGNRCAVNFEVLHLPISPKETLEALYKLGFVKIDVNIVTLARECIGKSKYQRAAKPSQAPGVVDCSSFVKWLYSQLGIWLPRRSIQQRELGEPIDLSSLQAGDLIFVSGFIDYFYEDPADGVGHVGITTGEQTIIHAKNKKEGVIESSLADFIANGKFRGARRYVPKDQDIHTFVTPASREVEFSDDIRWIVLQTLSSK